jgi:hypothetical protein
MPAGIAAGALGEVGPTRRTVVGHRRVAPGDVDRTATLHARVRNDGRAVRADVEVINCEVAQGFELFIQKILVDDRLTAVARFHSDANKPQATTP